jgi:hypothetical protein
MQLRGNATRARAGSARAQLNAEIEQLLLEVRGLVLVKGVLKRRGVSRAELEAHGREIERARRRLSDLIGSRGLDPRGVLGEAA